MLLLLLKTYSWLRSDDPYRQQQQQQQQHKHLFLIFVAICHRRSKISNAKLTVLRHLTTAAVAVSGDGDCSSFNYATTFILLMEVLVLVFSASVEMLSGVAAVCQFHFTQNACAQ